MGSILSSAPLQESTGSANEDGESRKRDRCHNSDNETETSAQSPPRKRRRVEILSFLPSPMAMASYAIRTAMDQLWALVGKAFISAVEVAVRNETTGEIDEAKERIQMLIQILDYFQASDGEILRRGWHAIYKCACVCDENNEYYDRNLEQEQQFIYGTSSGDVTTVIMVMKRYPESIKVQMLGCRALRTLTNSDDNWNALWEAGAIEVFLKALSNHPLNLVMQGLAITFLALLVREEGEPPRRQILEDGGVRLILAAMENFINDPYLLHTGCYALHQLGFFQPSRSKIIQHGGIRILLQSVEQHMDEVWLVDLCLSALSKLSDEESIRGQNAIPVVLKSMEHHPNERAVQGHCLVLFLRAIGSESTDGLIAIVASTVAAILAAMRNHEANSSVQFFGCAALREILLRMRHRPGREALNLICSNGGIECVLTAVQKHRDIFGLQPMALLLLMNIWEQRGLAGRAAYTAFGGSDNIVALVTGLLIDAEQGDDMD